MIKRPRTVEQERADLLAAVRANNPVLTTAYLVAVEPLDPRFQKWFVGAYASSDLALARAYEEYQQYPRNWVDTTVEEVELGYVMELPVSATSPVPSAEMVAA